MRDNPAPVKTPVCTVRKFDTDYDQFGFINAGNNA